MKKIVLALLVCMSVVSAQQSRWVRIYIKNIGGHQYVIVENNSEGGTAITHHEGCSCKKAKK